ncbi:TetR family transcriptional regulator C-terminal domain-containing protein [Marinomonas rhizomae]|uniref:TetR family transcriptional regulator C-terminal domain-containing protein n=1 Tax=Marinomonas rhizomae TaxID=491948 RepID=UPI0021077C7E|nr:TetR family transcriptional regulator C-terminal domain-containing protein [Marinomonas rhizomae]UTW01084.1 TetR family transcriptional regulator C-terminal domain-containing protein [Marinomonas rhizomae]
MLADKSKQTHTQCAKKHQKEQYGAKMTKVTKSVEKVKLTREEIQKNILQAAIYEFSRHGFIGTSTQSIAERAGLRKSQLHYYIVDKEDLYNQVLSKLFRAWGRLSELKSDSQTPAEILKHYIYVKLQFALKYPDLSRVFTMEILSGGERLAPFWPSALHNTKLNAEVINNWVQQGKIRSLDGRLLMMNIWALTQYYADYRIQAELVMSASLDESDLQDCLVNEVTTLILKGCGL